MGSFNATLLAALLSAGVSPDRAREVVEQFDRAIDERFGLHSQVLATKRDVAELQAAITDRIADSNERISRTNERIAETKADLVKRTLAAPTAQTALILGAFKLP
jgi:uncharacterized protein (DUF1697 family)